MSWPRYAILRKRTRSEGKEVMQGWTLHKRNETESVSYVVIASKLSKQTGERAKSKLLESKQYRHSLSLTRQGLHFITVHAESGGDADSRDYRASQLQYLARAYESVGGGACVLAGDFNLRPGEDQVLVKEGWRDSACHFDGVEPSNGWTWEGWNFRDRYDRVYIHAGVAKPAKFPHTHLIDIASPRDCREVDKQRPETFRSSLVFREQHDDHKPQELNASFASQANAKTLTAYDIWSCLVT